MNLFISDELPIQLLNTQMTHLNRLPVIQKLISSTVGKHIVCKLVEYSLLKIYFGSMEILFC